MRAEFDSLADEYHDKHKENIAITGEDPEFFSEYKIADLAAFVRLRKLPADSILDFGSGIGNSVPFFRNYFPDAVLHCGDVSGRSIEIAKTRFPGDEKYTLIGDTIPLASESQDIVFSACVFHHIPHEDHRHWLEELRRVTRPGGLLVIYEHNPFNPLTVRAVNTCPLDVNAKLIAGRTMGKRAESAAWKDAQVTYRVFFPSMFSFLRPIEKYLGWLALGAQYRMTALK
ncbi:SAM-dependent methyltransferase [Pseudomonas fluorescens]|nr:SAM-dependent methyltransferase [Pseudomonas fluorescens]